VRGNPFRIVAFRLAPLGVMLAAATAGWLAGPGWSERLGPLPWLVSLVVFGLPHGAADLAVTRRVGGRSATRVFSIYIACMAAVFVLFMAAPVPLVVLFAALSVWHFGMGHADGQAPPIGPGLVAQLRAAIARGAPVLGVPLAVWPAETAAIVTRLVDLVGSRSQVGLADAVFTPEAIRGVGIGLVVFGAMMLAAEAWATRRESGARRRSLDTAVDVGVIGILGAATDPLFAVGLSFLVWHAWRHLWLLAPLVTAVEPHDGPTLWRALVRLHQAALLLLVPTWGVILAAWWWLAPTHSARDLAILSLAVYLVVTPSHDLLIDLLRSRAHTEPRPVPEPSAISPSCAARLASSSS
jgi:Brp/Blh family beta-carotene 15,15'-monooxygenase